MIWKAETSEVAEAQTFWNEFFNVFGIHRRSVASFERTVRNMGGAYDRIDVIWKGVLIGEHKSRGEDLSNAATRAFGYVQSLTREGRDREVPRYIVVSDFATIVLHDLEAVDPLLLSVAFPVEDLHEHIRLFDFLNGMQSRPADPEDPINIDAVAVLGTLHDALEAGGYGGHTLERFLVRVLFCMFAEDTGIFEPDTFKLMTEESREDGSDLGPQLDRFFSILEKPEADRAAKLPESLRALPYVNGQLFSERLELADFDFDTLNALLAACRFRWAKISPAVFGSLFQSIMAGDAGKKKRRQIGAHYTSERDIMKLVRTEATDAQKRAVGEAAQVVLDARAAFPDETLADLYDPLAMPKKLHDTHRSLDRAVERCYRPQPFDSDRQRVEYLFALYEKLTTLFAPQKCSGKNRSLKGVQINQRQDRLSTSIVARASSPC